LPLQNVINMDFINQTIQAYAELHTTEESGILKELNRETHANHAMPQMLSGHLQGRLLSLFSQMIQPFQVLEIGTYTGYSALCMAEGLKNGGCLHTIDKDKNLKPVIENYIRKAGFEKKIKLYFGNALEIIPGIDEKFDLVFIDADKSNYSNYFDLVIEKTTKGGYIIADNVLWSGRVLDEKKDNRTKALEAYNNKVNADPRVENILLPVRDGLMVARKLD
jgi:predicted O-methyltransferase YrrM